MNVSKKNAVLAAKVAAGLLAVGVFTGTGLGAHDVPPPEWSPRAGCAYTIEPGDTLFEIGKAQNMSVSQLMLVNPWIDHEDRIAHSVEMDVCSPGMPAQAMTLDDRIRSLAVEPEPVVREELPGQAYEWAEAVVATAPPGTSDADIRKMVAVGGPESGWDNTAFNSTHTDAGWSNGVLYRGSAGVVQIRVMDSPPSSGVDSVRNLDWLNEPGLEQEAIAAWTIKTAQGWDAWGPLRTNAGQLKLHEDCGQVASSRRDACREYWRVADVALAAVGS